MSEVVRKAPNSEIGSSGLAIGAGGSVDEELHPHLSGRKSLEVFRSMKDNDALVGAILYAIDMLVRQVEWRVDQGKAKEKDAEFLRECMEDMSMSWGDFISEVLSMLPFGFAFHEIVYKQRKGFQKPDSKVPSSRFDDGKIGWRKMPLRAQETLDKWAFDDQGGIEAFVQRSAPDYTEIPIPISKGLLFRPSVYKNNPEGRSVLRSAYPSWFYKKRIQTIEGTGIERDLAGFPVFWLPATYLSENAGEEETRFVNMVKNMGENVRRDKQEYMILPLAYDGEGRKIFEFELMNSGGSRTFDTNQIIQRYNQEIAMSVLADFILLGHEKVGSFSLSSDKTDIFGVALGTILDSIADVLNRYAVPRLFELNNLPMDALPTIEHGDIEKPDLSALGGFLQVLQGMGMTMFPDDDLEAWLRDIAGLPEQSEEAKKQRKEAEEKGEEGDDGEDGGAGPDGGTGGEQPVVEGTAEDEDLAGL